MDRFTYLSRSVSSTENDINMCLAKSWTAIDRFLIIWMSNLSDEIKRDFVRATVVSILLYGCTTWTVTKRIRVIGNKSWKQPPAKQQLYGNIPPISKTIQMRLTRHMRPLEKQERTHKRRFFMDAFTWKS